MTTIEIGRLLKAGIAGFVAGCQVSQFNLPSFGALVQVSPEGNRDYKIYGLIHDIHIDEDGLIRQLVTTENISQEVMKDNRERRIVPVEMSVLAVGYELEGRIFHLLPPRPPLSLDMIYLCTADEISRFTGKFGYFRHILNGKDVPIGEVIAAHLLQAGSARGAESGRWKEAATHEVITLLRDDYPTLMSVLGALSSIQENA